ncbi:DegT/DnrJ/EryC1/StrS family aminotransferase [Gammaproteobacteria bacterium]|nr:DegT/DnrJ/EryC1/StrS family aminotransferase [Gammaproteobacteria bacterium]
MIEYENLGKLNSVFFQEYQDSFKELLDSGWYVLGQNVKSFEENFAFYNEAKYGVGLASGLDALLLSLKALDLSPGDEVLVPSNTYIATIIAIVQAGLVPILVEPNINTYNIEASEIEKHVTQKSKAIAIVHLYGKSCDMDSILALCKKYGLRLIEDAAQSHGAMYKGKKTGTFGDYGCFSFYPTKNLGALGDAGAVICNDEEKAFRVKQLRNYGSSKKYHNDVLGYNSRLDEIQAGFLNIKLKSLDKITNHKRMLAQLYFENLDDKYIKPNTHKDFFDVYHIFNIRYKNRDKLREYMLKKNVQTEIHYPVTPRMQPAMKGILSGSYPIAEEIHNTTLSLPISFSHSKEDILKVCDVMNKFNL